MPGTWLKRGLLALSTALLVAAGFGVPGKGMLAAALNWLLFLIFAVVVWFWARLGQPAPAGIEDGGWPTLRQLGWLAPVSVAAQIGLGVAYHYEVLGAVPHLAWAFAAAIVLMMLASFILTHAQAPGYMKATAGVVLGATGIQAVLGVAALLGRSTPEWGPAVTAVHAGVGALVLGSAVTLGVQIQRHVTPAPTNVLAEGRQ